MTDSQELADIKAKDLENFPGDGKVYIIEDKTIMSPGVWKGNYYSSETIEKIHKQTSWEDPDVRRLFLDHEDDQARKQIGEVKNPRLENGAIVGDLYVLQKETAKKIAYGANLGISPKVEVEKPSDESKKIISGSIRNNSIVENPAIKTAYVNNSDVSSELGDSNEVTTDMTDKTEELEEWSTEYINNLPDSAFAYIEPGGEKDEDGKTKPRSLRHLPYKNKEGNIDEAHTRNALSRLPQTDIPQSAKEEARKKLEKAAKEVGIDVSDEEEDAEKNSNRGENNMTDEDEDETKEDKSEDVENEDSEIQLSDEAKEYFDEKFDKVLEKIEKIENKDTEENEDEDEEDTEEETSEEEDEDEDVEEDSETSEEDEETTEETTENSDSENEELSTEGAERKTEKKDIKNEDFSSDQELMKTLQAKIEA